jgi:hypothetical protein
MFVVLLRTFGDLVMVGRPGAINSSKMRQGAGRCGTLAFQPFLFACRQLMDELKPLSVKLRATCRCSLWVNQPKLND